MTGSSQLIVTFGQPATSEVRADFSALSTFSAQRDFTATQVSTYVRVADDDGGIHSAGS